jgi:hypothetical protein
MNTEKAIKILIFSIGNDTIRGRFVKRRLKLVERRNKLVKDEIKFYEDLKEAVKNHG